jgi:hypothetical protein
VTALRWMLGAVSVVVGAGWLALALFGNTFRSSFGASPVALLTRAGPVIVVGLVLASVALPSNRALLHATAIVVALACAGLVFLLRESVFVGTLGLAYGAAWFAFYAKSI